METLITFEQAAARLPGNILINLCETGKIQVNQFSGVLLVNETDINNQLPKEEREDYKALGELAGIPISISEAGRKYDIPQQTISRWVQKGYIKRLGSQGRKQLIDSQDIAFYAGIYNANGGHQGRWIIRNGKPYQKKISK